jgi:hypothetical protein
MVHFLAIGYTIWSSMPMRFHMEIYGAVHDTLHLETFDSDPTKL